MLLSKCAVCGCKKSKFHKDQAASGLLLGPNSKMFYYWYSKQVTEIVNKYLLVADKFMFEMYLRELVFTYSVYHSLKTKTEKKSLKKQVIPKILIKTN